MGTAHVSGPIFLKYDTPRWSLDSSKLYSLGSKAWWQFDLESGQHHGTSAWSRDALDDLCRRVVDWFNCHVAEAQSHEQLV